MKLKNIQKKIRHQFWEIFPGHYLINCQINNLDFKYYTKKTDDLFREAAVSKLKNFEKESMRYWISALENGGIAIDVGAYTGIYSIVAHKAGANFVFSFEPNDEIAVSLQKNLEINGISNRTKFVGKALGATQSEKFLLIPQTRLNKTGKKTRSGAQIEDANNNRNLKNWIRLRKVTISTLDDELSGIDSQLIKAIKIDVEGYELEVLEGAQRILKLSKPSLIIESLTENAEREIINFLKPFGYNLIKKDHRNLLFAILN